MGFEQWKDQISNFERMMIATYKGTFSPHCKNGMLVRITKLRCSNPFFYKKHSESVAGNQDNTTQFCMCRFAKQMGVQGIGGNCAVLP